jgi:hypothetical protein
MPAQGKAELSVYDLHILSCACTVRVYITIINTSYVNVLQIKTLISAQGRVDMQEDL